MAEIEIRSAQLGEVSYPQRRIELVVMPYETPAVVGYHGREIVEICSRGAYDGIERRANRVRANRDHDVSRTIGKAVSFHPSREEGLVAALRIARTDLGDETLALADEGCLDASAGFCLLLDERTGKVKEGAEVWESRDRRRLNHLWLDHVALTPDPAFVTANVLAVRNRDHIATPNRDRLQLAELLAREREIDARYGRPAR